MSYRIDEIEGIGPTFREKLQAAGITTTEHLLTVCSTADGRTRTSATTGIGTGQLLKWTNMADLMRIAGIGKQFAELLEAAGVDTVMELKHRRPENLATKMTEINADKKLARTAPPTSLVEGWVKQAADLPALITH